MATTLGSPDWGSSPTIPCRWTYDRRRNGAAMEYRVYGYVNTNQATRYFGYYIYARVTADGTQRLYVTLKDNSPSQWSTQYTFDTGWFSVANKTSGTTSVTITLETNAPRGNSSWSYNMAVDPAGSTLTVTGTRVLGQAQTLTLTRYSSSFTDSIRWACGTSGDTIATKSTEKSFSFTPGIDLAAKNTTGTTVTVQFIVDTYSGNTLVQSKTLSITYTIPDSVKPTAAIQISDAMGYAATYGAYVQGQSKLQIAITGTEAYGAAITAYTATADGTSYSGQNITTAPLSNTGQQTASAKVKDARGRESAAAEAAYNVLPYTLPQLSKITVNRCQQDGTDDPTGHYAEIIFSAEIASLQNQNSAAYKLRYKKTGDTTWTEVQLTTYAGDYSVTDGEGIIAADDDSTYDVQIVATDDFGSATLNGTIPIAFALINWNLSGQGMAIGGISTKDELQIYLPISGNGILDYVHPVGSIYISENSTDPGTLFGGTWEQIKDTFLLTAGDTYTAGATGGEATHTLTESEMPAHRHRTAIGNAAFNLPSGSSNNFISNYGYNTTGSYYTETNGLHTSQVGGGAAHNNMPPYQVVYAWKRVS